ncbi:hypothetical protein QYF36_002607 [Acer negundo]|nr:hypothetical protein QYF36_002607 [Acer negundo]
MADVAWPNIVDEEEGRKVKNRSQEIEFRGRYIARQLSRELRDGEVDVTYIMFGNLAMIGVVLLRTICDFLYLICLTIPQWTRFRQKYSRNHFLFLSCLLVLSNLPLPQGTVISLFIRQKTQTGMSFVAVIIYSQIPLRIIIIVCHLNYLANPLGGFDIRLFVLIYSWSAYAHCWKKACKMLTGCDDDRFCDESLRHYQGNTTNCSFGIYNELIQYHIVEVKDFPRKLLFCFRWGLQSLSSFGQNLQTDGNTRDNLFVIAISISGVLLFVILIGEMQRYKQSVDARVERRKLKVQQLHNCMLFKNLSENLQQQVKEYRGSVWKETKGVSVKGIDAVNLLSDLSEDLKRKIKRELCLGSLKKVKEFERWSEAMLDELCDCVKPVSYTEHTHIVLEGDKIDEILFCVQGKLRTYLVRNVNTGYTAGSSRRRTILNHLRDGDEFFGEELVAWFQADPYSSDLPISTKTILVLTEVVGFAFMSVDLKKGYCALEGTCEPLSRRKHHQQSLISRNNCRLRSRFKNHKFEFSLGRSFSNLRAFSQGKVVGYKLMEIIKEKPSIIQDHLDGKCLATILVFIACSCFYGDTWH